MRTPGVPRIAIAGVCGAVLSLAAPVAAAESVNLKSAVRLGSHWYGPELALEDLEGRVVLIEDWGLK